jgi:RHS repeat-associated protein
VSFVRRDRYGFQGQESDPEIKGEGNSVNYKYRMHDPRIGRFFAVDPMSNVYAHYSPYLFSGNRIIDAVELEGREPTPYEKSSTGTEGAMKKETKGNSLLGYDTFTLVYHAGGKYTEAGWYTKMQYDFITVPLHQNTKDSEFNFKLKHWWYAPRIGSGAWSDKFTIATSASVFSTNVKFNGIDDKGKDLTKQNAFQHALLMAMTTYEMNKETAEDLGNCHESYPNMYLNLQNENIWELRFSSQGEADTYADLVNNHLARELGDSWDISGMNRKEQAELVLLYFYNNGFVVGGKDPSDPNKYKVWTHKLTEEEYNNAKTNLDKMNNWGFNKLDGELYEQTKGL